MVKDTMPRNWSSAELTGDNLNSAKAFQLAGGIKNMNKPRCEEPCKFNPPCASCAFKGDCK